MDEIGSETRLRVNRQARKRTDSWGLRLRFGGITMRLHLKRPVLLSLQRTPVRVLVSRPRHSKSTQETLCLSPACPALRSLSVPDHTLYFFFFVDRAVSAGEALALRLEPALARSASSASLRRCCAAVASSLSNSFWIRRTYEHEKCTYASVACMTASAGRSQCRTLGQNRRRYQHEPDFTHTNAANIYRNIHTDPLSPLPFCWFVCVHSCT